MSGKRTISSTRLPSRFAIEGLIGVTAWCAAAVMIHVGWFERIGIPQSERRLWLLGFSAAMGFAVVVLLYAIAVTERKSAGHDVPRRFGLANHLTLLRGTLLSVCFGFAFILRRPEYTWFPFVLYAVALALDFVDGYLARITGNETTAGEVLEHEYDSLGVIAASVVAWSWGALPFIFVPVAFGRYIYLAAERIRILRGRPMHPLTYSISGRVIAGLYMGFLAASLMPALPPPLLRAGAPFFLVPFIGSFLRDWLIGCGTLRTDGSIYTWCRRFVSRWLLGVFPVFVRTIAALACVVTAVESGGLSSGMLVTAALCLAVGAFARTAALLVMAVLAFVVFPQLGGTLLIVSTFALCTAVLVLGSGRLSLARPEERPFAVRIG